ncbi:hypothetical protein SAMN05444506_12610 [Pseudomonas syringae]|nr:hypothetical protein SAMN05444506_12610 [Pseudomonas syringae]SOQ16376.1 hypothetical protein CFBP1573P_06070 [Pseudomonas syringae pv. persicae]
MVSPFLVQLRIYYPFSIILKKQLLIPENTQGCNMNVRIAALGNALSSFEVTNESFDICASCRSSVHPIIMLSDDAR